MYDLVIHNARICDGTGQPSFLGTLGANDGLITYLGEDAGLAAQRSIDAAGLALARDLSIRTPTTTRRSPGISC